jgi:hypothetical protein
MRRLKVKLSKTPLLTVTRSKQWSKRMVYILVANKSYKYRSGLRSPIIYIGTTGKGGARPATSAVSKAGQAFKKLHGVKTIDVYLATCRGRKAMKTWQHLEAALLYTFWNAHFQLPIYNMKKGARYIEGKTFSQKALKKLILQFQE